MEWHKPVYFPNRISGFLRKWHGKHHRFLYFTFKSHVPCYKSKFTGAECPCLHTHKKYADPCPILSRSHTLLFAVRGHHYS